MILIINILTVTTIGTNVSKNNEDFMYPGQKKFSYAHSDITDNIKNRNYRFQLNNQLGKVLWHFIDEKAFRSLVAFCKNSNYLFVGQEGYQSTENDHSIFQLFKTHGNGNPIWKFDAPEYTSWMQIDASEDSNVLVGLATSDMFDEKNHVARLFKWDVENRNPTWYFDIPEELHVFNGFFVEHNICVSDNGKKIALAANNFSQQLIKLFVFSPDSNEPVITFPIYFDYQYVYINLIDISYDGKFVLISNDIETIIIDTTIPEIRWRGDHDQNRDTENYNIAAMSNDGSILACQYWDYGHCVKIFKWDEKQNNYIDQKDLHIAERGWFISMSTYTLDLSDDGSTLLVGVDDIDDFESRTKLVMFDIPTGKKIIDYETYAEGRYGNNIKEVKLSKDGSRGVVGYCDDEFNTNTELKIFDKNKGDITFELDTPAGIGSVDISSNGGIVSGGGDLLPGPDGGIAGISYCIDLDANNNKPNNPTIKGKNKIRPGFKYTYTFSAIDPDGDEIYLYVDWGDGANTGWIGPYNSGEEVDLAHSWEKGSYEIKANARDISCYNSEWVDFDIVSSKARFRQGYLIDYLFKMLILKFPILKNLI